MNQPHLTNGQDLRILAGGVSQPEIPASNPAFRPHRKWLLVGLVVALCVLVAIAALLGYLLEPQSEDPMLFVPKRDCRGDGFSNLMYNVSAGNGHEANGKTVTRFIKYKFVDDVFNSNLYSDFHSAVQKCLELNSTLWELLDDEAEWNSMIAMAKDKGLLNIWLNGRVLERCPTPTEDGYCLEAEASLGKGLAIQWPSSARSRSAYSRLYQEVGPEKNCVFIDRLTDQLLWGTTPCDEANFWALCTKRDCFLE